MRAARILANSMSKGSELNGPVSDDDSKSLELCNNGTTICLSKIAYLGFTKNCVFLSFDRFPIYYKQILKEIGMFRVSM